MRRRLFASELQLIPCSPPLKRRSTPRAKARSLRIGALAVAAGQKRSRLGQSRTRRRGYIHGDVDRPAYGRCGHAQRSGDASRLNRVEFPYPAGHKETLDDPKDGRNPWPEEAAVENPQPGAA